MGSDSPTRRKIQGRELELSVLQLRKRGHTYAEIAQACSCTPMGAYKACQRALAQLEELAEGEARELRRLQLARLDTALARIWAQVEEGQLPAIDRMIRLLERQSKLLGLDSAEKHEVTGRSGSDVGGLTDEELEARIARARRILGAAPDPAEAPESQAGPKGEDGGA